MSSTTTTTSAPRLRTKRRRSRSRRRRAVANTPCRRTRKDKRADEHRQRIAARNDNKRSVCVECDFGPAVRVLVKQMGHTLAPAKECAECPPDGGGACDHERRRAALLAAAHASALKRHDPVTSALLREDLRSVLDGNVRTAVRVLAASLGLDARRSIDRAAVRAAFRRNTSANQTQADVDRTVALALRCRSLLSMARLLPARPPSGCRERS